MAKSLLDWIETEVRPLKDQPLKWLSENFFFRDPSRAAHCDTSCFFAPADGTILYQKTVRPDECVVAIKGKNYTLRDAMRDDSFDQQCLVIATFMSFYDVHVNRVPYAGRLSYRELDALDTYNHPMLDVEKALLEDLRLNTDTADYLYHNQRVLNRVYAPELGQWYYVLQIADYDVDSITPFELKQNQPCGQGQRFSQIRYGSQVDLIVPLSERFDFHPTQEVGMHVEAGVDTLIRITDKCI